MDQYAITGKFKLNENLIKIMHKMLAIMLKRCIGVISWDLDPARLGAMQTQNRKAVPTGKKFAEYGKRQQMSTYWYQNIANRDIAGQDR